MQQTVYTINLLPWNFMLPQDLPPPPPNKFYLSIILSRRVDIYSADDDVYIEHDDSTTIEHFTLEPSMVLYNVTVLQEILSSMEIPLDNQPEIVHNIFSFARSIFGGQNYTNLSLTLQIVMGMIVLSDAGSGTDTDEAEAWAMEESGDMFTPVPASVSSIKALEKTRLLDGLNSTQMCMVCLEKLNSDVEVTRMPCSHIYHGDCIVRWLETSHLCPVCRFQMPT